MSTCQGDSIHIETHGCCGEEYYIVVEYYGNRRLPVYMTTSWVDACRYSNKRKKDQGEKS